MINEGNLCDTLAAPIGCNGIIAPIIAVVALTLIVWWVYNNY